MIEINGYLEKFQKGFGFLRSAVSKSSAEHIAILEGHISQVDANSHLVIGFFVQALLDLNGTLHRLQSVTLGIKWPCFLPAICPGPIISFELNKATISFIII